MIQNGGKTSNLKCQHQQEARQRRILISIPNNWVPISPFFLFWLFCSQWRSKVCCRTQRRGKTSRGDGGRAGGLVLGRAIVQLGHKLWKFPMDMIITKFLIVSHYVHYFQNKLTAKMLELCQVLDLHDLHLPRPHLQHWVAHSQQSLST